MSFEIGPFINTIIDRITESEFIGSIARNPLYTALLITIVIILIIMFVFRDIDTEDGLFSLSLRTGFYIFVFMVSALLIHNRVLMKETSVKEGKSEVASVFANNAEYSGINGGHTSALLEDSIIPINVNYSPY